ncbi:LOW QUALITY PROTEIN: hypothetical protein Cgig2_005597 [Carnegiea gigantea]|uniref:Protein kinase domain-containing protein n=1 Tax=Carnegiea gigantea TaxID=171969 RepID=A0A9Q1KV22_9CARY|nr:LOW QUALITY PROTEIN: hypothetical protein Cgig2_005597 [Carnegiea gigantea]
MNYYCSIHCCGSDCYNSDSNCNNLLLKEAHAQAQLTIGANKPNPNQVCAHDNPTYLTKANMEQFLSDIAKEKPIRLYPQELMEITNNFSQVLGSRRFGIVYKGVFPDRAQIAVKLLKDVTSKNVKEQFKTEVGTMGRTYHINLVRLYGFCFDTTMRALVYEYMEEGSLDNFLFGDPKGSIEWSKLHEIAIGTAWGIAYLHEACRQRIIHYDIKPGNVLLDANLNPKEAGFNNRDSTHIVCVGGPPPRCAAPELWTPYLVTHDRDVYGFSMLLFENGGGETMTLTLVETAKSGSHDGLMTSSTRVGWLDILLLVGIPEEDREEANRMVKARPMMSTLVKMLLKRELRSIPHPIQLVT